MDSLYTTVIFDYGGVIDAVPNNTQNIGLFEVLADGLNINIEDVKTLYFANNHKNNLGDWTHKQTLLYVVEKLAPEKGAEAEKLIDDFLSQKEINQELLGIIKNLQASGYRVALLSNYGAFLRDHITKNGVAKIFDPHIFISGEIGYQKPDPAIFAHTFSSLNVAPGEVIFVDDSPKSLSTAKEVGYTPLRYTSNQSLLTDLRRLGLRI
jgi:HAD superfamily hydrolase (TIGR01509 family)